MSIAIDAPVEIAGIQFGNALMNGAYIGSKTLGDATVLANATCGAIVVGSISIQPRKANVGQGYWPHKERIYSLNSFGMPNGGMPYFKKNLPLIADIAHAQGKPLIANLAGFSNEEFVTLVALAQDSGADMAELNFGCPNVWEAGQQKHIISYHPKLVEETLKYISQCNPKIKLSVKISPLPPDLLRDVSKVIADSHIIQAVTATNSQPNASISTGTGATGKNMLAGLSGRALKPISLGVVTQLRDLLPRDIDIVGCGGVSTANDVRDYLSAGAKAVQIATALVEEGTSAFEKILFQAKRF